MSPTASVIGSSPAANSNIAERSGFRFGIFTYLPDRALLLRDGAAVRIGSRALDILGCLLERAGAVVDKQTIAHRVWPAVRVEEVGVRVHVAALRKALGDGEEGARYIINVPGRGYQFVAPVDRLDDAEPRQASDARLLLDAMDLLKDPNRLQDAIDAVDSADLGADEIVRVVSGLVDR